MPDLDRLLHDVIEGALAPLDVDAIVERRRRQRRRRRIDLAVAAVVVIGAGSAIALASGSHTSRPVVTVNPTTTPSTALPKAVGPQRYEIDALVEQDRAHGPMLCVYPTASVAYVGQSDCAGPLVKNWDWSKAPDPQRANGATSGTYHLVGTYDGHVFTVTQPPEIGHIKAPPTPVLDAPCPTPAGGWQATNTSRIALANFQALQSVAQGAPDFAGMWVSSTKAGAPINDFQHSQVTIVAYTGHLAEHRVQLAAVWGGPVCVVQHAHSYAELQALQHRILNDLDANRLSLQMFSVGADEVHDAVELEVLAATDATQRSLDHRYGAGMVRVSSLMKPIP